jgi:hypothetical protein
VQRKTGYYLLTKKRAGLTGAFFVRAYLQRLNLRKKIAQVAPVQIFLGIDCKG